MLPLALKRRATSLARQMGVSLSELIRESLEATLRGYQGEVREDSLYGDAAVHRGAAPDDLSEDHDLYLYGGRGESGSS
jgi:hypothetical protein